MLLRHRSVRTARLALLVFALLSFATAPKLHYTAHASSGQSVPLYLHLLPANVSIGSSLTRQVLNTTTLWNNPSPSPNLRYTIFNFTLYPALALDLSSTGSGSIRLWVTVSGAPGDLNATIYDVSAAGQQAVVTTSIGVTNSTNPNTPYEVTIPFAITHTFSQSSTIRLSLTASRVGQLYLWYDSAVQPAALVLPGLDLPTISLVETFDWNLNRETRFSLNWTDPQRVVSVTVHVADPFGAYDVANATVSILDPGSSRVYTGIANPLSANPGASEKLFGINWGYPQTAQPGNYTISVLAKDQRGGQGSATGRLTLYNSASQPPVTEFPLFYFLLATGLGLLALLIALLLFRRRVKCTKCGAKISAKLERCPKCGNPSRR